MKKFSPYITFNGDCLKALEFYKTIFKGEFYNVSFYRDSPIELGDDDQDRIMHAVFDSTTVYFLAADSMPDCSVVIGDNISLSLEFTHEEELKRVYDLMSEVSTVVMPLQDSFWGSSFGMIIDPFGLSWMFNWEGNQPKSCSLDR